MTVDGPTYNLKAVVKETGIKPDTLRAWERRYGMPQPARSSGGHRLYTQRDIDTLKWLIARQNEGLSISRAVELWRTLELEGQDPLAIPEYAQPQPESGTIVISGDQVEKVRQAWIEACLAFNEAQAEQILSQAFAMYPVMTVCIQVIQHGLREIGSEWYQGKITVHQEHFTSSLAIRRLNALLTASPRPTRPGRILLACPPQEEHTIGLKLLELMLRHDGWDVVNLGANLPIEAIDQSVRKIKPRIAILSANLLLTAQTLSEMAAALQELQVPVAFGGPIFDRIPRLAERIPGYFLGKTLENAQRSVETIMANPDLGLASPQNVSRAATAALAEFEIRQADIHAQVNRLCKGAGIPENQLTIANLNLSQRIVAALKLGDIQLLESDIHWLEGFLRNFQAPENWLRAYLRCYHQAAGATLHGPGRMIVEWLASISETRLAHPEYS